MILRNKKKMLVVAHDAGAAEIIAGYVHAHTKQNIFFCFAAGPAAKIFRREKIAHSLVTEKTVSSIIHKYRTVDAVLTGTGWMTSIESTTLAEAKKIGLKTIVYLDSWGDYRERFGYPRKGWRTRVADELWCGDIHALKLVKKYFHEVPAQLVPNLYLRDSIKRTRALRRRHKPSYVLFLSRPNSSPDVLADEIAENLSKRKTPPTFRIRLHPAEKTQAWFDALVKKYRGRVRIIKSQTADIAQDFSGALAVVGKETVAMAISSDAGIRTIRIVERGNQLLLPYRSIIRVRSASAAAQLV